MNPLRLEAMNVARFERIDLDLIEGVTAIVGPNGAGKSTILNSIEAALFADGARDLAPMLSPDADRLQITLVFEHDGETYRVRRTYQSGTRGRATVDFERHVYSGANGPSDAPGGWATLTRETASATNDAICELIGLSRRAFLASAFLSQGASGFFAEAPAGDRKKILGEMLDPTGLWPRLCERARTEARAADLEQQRLLGEMTAREDQLAKQPELELAVAHYAQLEHNTRLTLRSEEIRLEQAQQKVVENAAATQRIHTLTAADDHARSERDRISGELARAHGAAGDLAEAEHDLSVVKGRAAAVPDLEAKVEAQRTARAAADTAVLQRERAFEVAAGFAATATRISEEGQLLDYERRVLAEQHAHLNAASAGTERCPTCEQLLGAEARDAALKTLSEQLDGLDAAITAKSVALLEAEELARRARAEADAILIPQAPKGDFAAELREARAAVTYAAATEARIDALRETAGRLPEWEAALELRNRTLEQTSAELADALSVSPFAEALDEDVVRAKRTVAAARTTLEAAVHDLTRARQQLEQLNATRLEHEGLLRERERKQLEIDVLKLAERAFGRDGIPALIAENAIPQIEQEANRILELMPTVKGETLRVELRTQRELKTAEHLRETLDIMVVDAYRPRPYETYSGGEHGRINIALRLALSKLLTTRRGAESRLLVLDEVPHLDALGEEQLVQVVLDGAGNYDRVLVVTHSNIRDVFETTIELASDEAGMSFVVGSEAPVLELAAARGAR